jgi:hypothetical protein
MFDRRETFALFEISLSRYLDSLEEGFHQQVSNSQIRQIRTVFDASVPHNGPYGANLVPERRSPIFSGREAPYCRARLIRRAMTSERAINSKEQSGPFTRKKTSAGRLSSWTLR